ncbi:hypothetical protein [Thauera humireducens]|uniref:hypothetical protein n=1 Tax=Thauera humireducens TaxID=1134435 RepID=UPI00311F5BA5
MTFEPHDAFAVNAGDRLQDEAIRVCAVQKAIEPTYVVDLGNVAAVLQLPAIVQREDIGCGQLVSRQKWLNSILSSVRA